MVLLVERSKIFNFLDAVYRVLNLNGEARVVGFQYAIYGYKPRVKPRRGGVGRCRRV